MDREAELHTLVMGDTKGAVIEHCWRYALWRRWSSKPRWIGWVMLNPSTADGTLDDPTIRKCLGFSQRFGATGMIVINLFAYRATDPSTLRQAHETHGVDIIGQHNLEWLAAATRVCDKLICAWGNGGTYLGQSERVLEFLRAQREEPCIPWLYHVGNINQSGCPRHPLYVKNDAPVNPIPKHIHQHEAQDE